MKTFNISGVIGEEITPDNVRELFESANYDDVEIKLSTIGGYIYEGLEIFNIIRDYPGNTNVILNGLVASIGAYISTAFNKVIAQENAIFMIHNAMGGAIGDWKVLQGEADHLKALNNHIANAYANKTGRERKLIVEDMDAETWFYGDDIVAAGYADNIKTVDGEKNKDVELLEAQNKFKTFEKSIKPEQRHDDVMKAVAMLKTPGNKKPGVKNIKGVKNMSKEELFKKLMALKQNGDVTLKEIAISMGLENQLVNEKHENALSVLKKINKLIGEVDPVEYIEDVLDREKKNNKSIRNAALVTNFGPEIHEETKKKNLGREYAEKIIGDKEITEELVNEIKEDAIYKKLIADRADWTSDVNLIEDDNKKNPDEPRKIEM